MGVEYVCDGCGKREPAVNTRSGFEKPRKWFERSDHDGTQVVCSRECIEKVSKTTGKTRVVAPF